MTDFKRTLIMVSASEMNCIIAVSNNKTPCFRYVLTFWKENFDQQK